MELTTFNNEFSSMEKYTCVVWGYALGHSHLYVRMYIPPFKPEEHLYLVFYSVKYFSGYLKWNNSKIRIGTTEETNKIIKPEIIGLSGNSIHDYLSSYNLFIIENRDISIIIFAGKTFEVIVEPVSFVKS